MVLFYGSDITVTTNYAWKFVNYRLQLSVASQYYTLKSVFLRDFVITTKTLVLSDESLYNVLMYL